MLSDTRSDETRRAYANDLRAFFGWQGYTDATPDALTAFVSLAQGDLAMTLTGYKVSMLDTGKSESTINRRLAAIRSLLRTARRFGAPCADPAGLVASEKVTAYRDTRGPALSEARRLLAAPNRSTLRGKRDYAIFCLFCENALRRGEVVKCNVSDFDAGENRLYILGKGRGSQREPITISAVTVEAIGEYLAAKPGAAADAPLFANCDRAQQGDGRLTGRGLAKVIDTYGQKAIGKRLHPHALRHMAITAYLDATGDVRKAQKLSRHRDLRTLQIYDDARSDFQGEATGVLSDLLTKGYTR
jgi:integrase/recombinase XerC